MLSWVEHEKFYNLKAREYKIFPHTFSTRQQWYWLDCTGVSMLISTSAVFTRIACSSSCCSTISMTILLYTAADKWSNRHEIVVPIAYCMGESSKFSKSWTLEYQNLKLALCLQMIKNSRLNGQIPLYDRLKLNQKSYYYLQNSAFWGWLSLESQPQNPEFRNNSENFHP